MVSFMGFLLQENNLILNPLSFAPHPHKLWAQWIKDKWKRVKQKEEYRYTRKTFYIFIARRKWMEKF